VIESLVVEGEEVSHWGIGRRTDMTHLQLGPALPGIN
jgi:hypothetical protein